MKARSDQTLIHDLRELIAALDRRVPVLEREGEHGIAHDAQALRRAALKRTTELDQSPAAPDSVLAVAGVSPCEEKCPFPRVAGQRGRRLEF
jgi:hypothetical protein